MKRRRWTALTMAMALGVPAGAQSQAIGVIGGLNVGSISGDAPENTEVGRSTNYVLGLAGEIRLTTDVDLLLQPTYAGRGSSLMFEGEGRNESGQVGSIDLSYITVPVIIKVYTANRRTFVTSGLDFGFLTNATLKEGAKETDVKERLEDFDVAAMFGFGGVIVDRKPKLTLELRYSQSLLNLANGGTTAQAFPARFRSRGFQLLAGVLMPFGGAR